MITTFLDKIFNNKNSMYVLYMYMNIFNVTDGASTIASLNNGNTELNPIYMIVGLQWFLIIKFTLVALIGYIIIRESLISEKYIYTNVTFFFMCIVFSALSINNTILGNM